jgi:hypothetical protein
LFEKMMIWTQQSGGIIMAIWLAIDKSYCSIGGCLCCGLVTI